jgi:hypothetical protein
MQGRQGAAAAAAAAAEIGQLHHTPGTYPCIGKPASGTCRAGAATAGGSRSCESLHAKVNACWRQGKHLVLFTLLIAAALCTARYVDASGLRPTRALLMWQLADLSKPLQAVYVPWGRTKGCCSRHLGSTLHQRQTCRCCTGPSW